jgi:hypothetical protein
VSASLSLALASLAARFARCSLRSLLASLAARPRLTRCAPPRAEERDELNGKISKFETAQLSHDLSATNAKDGIEVPAAGAAAGFKRQRSVSDPADPAVQAASPPPVRMADRDVKRR